MEQAPLIWGVIRSILYEKIRFETIKAILAVAGADIITRPEFQTHSLLNEIDSQFSKYLGLPSSQNGQWHTVGSLSWGYDGARCFGNA